MNMSIYFSYRVVLGPKRERSEPHQVLRLRTNMKRQKLAVGSVAQKYNKTYVFYHRKWTVWRWGLGENDATLIKYCACAQE